MIIEMFMIVQNCFGSHVQRDDEKNKVDLKSKISRLKLNESDQ